MIAPGGLGPEIAQDFIDGFIAETRARKLKPVLEMLTADPTLVTADMVEDVLKFKRLDGATAALQKIADANFVGGQQRGSLRDRLAGLTMPVQVIWGEADRVLPAKHADGLAAEREGDAHRRRRSHPASGEGGGRERRDQGVGIRRRGEAGGVGVATSNRPAFPALDQLNTSPIRTRGIPLVSSRRPSPPPRAGRPDARDLYRGEQRRVP